VISIAVPQDQLILRRIIQVNILLSGRRAYPNRNQLDYLNRFFGFRFGWLPAEISNRISCASLASLSSRRRAMLARTSAAFFAIGFCASSAVRRCRVTLSTFESLVSSDTRATILLSP